MQTIEIKKANALIAYRGADTSGKKLLEELLGKDNVSGNIMDLVKTFQDACDLEGVSSSSVLPYTQPSNDDEDICNSVKASLLINRVLNEGWVADFSDKEQKKWYVILVWDESVSAFRFNYSNYAYTFTVTYTGARLYFKTPELARYFATQFIDILNNKRVF